MFAQRHISAQSRMCVSNGTLCFSFGDAWKFGVSAIPIMDKKISIPTRSVHTHTDYKTRMKRKKQASLYTVHETHFSIQEASTKLPIFVADPDSIARIGMRSDSNSILALSARFHVAAT